MLAMMRGDTVRVIVTPGDVVQFARRWPCCNIPEKTFNVWFDKESNLVDLSLSEDYEGLPALIEDAEEFAREKGLLQ